MQDDDDDGSETWMARFLAEALPYADLLQGAAAQTGYPTWRVEEREPGQFAVLRNGAPDGAPPDAVAASREIAYMLAATFTAMGGAEPREGPPPGPLPTGPLAEADPRAAYMMTQLLAKPEAVELLFEAADPEVRRQALEILHGRMREEDGEN